MSPSAAKKLRSYEDCLRLYEQGKFEIALEALLDLSAGIGRPDPRAVILLANLNLRLGKIEAAGDAFTRAADISAEGRPLFLKNAALLYLKAGAEEKLAGIGSRAAIANKTDHGLVFKIAKCMMTMGKVEEVGPLLDYLDRKNAEHVYFRSDYFRRLDDPQRSYEILLEGIADCPSDIYLKIELYSRARSMCDFDRMREFDQMMLAPVSPVANQILLNQMALDRLYWCDDEATQKQLAQDSRPLVERFGPQDSSQRSRRRIADGTRKLRVGYLSNDFRNTAVMSVIEETLLLHDRERFDIRLFCYGKKTARAYQAKWPDFLRNSVIQIAEMSDADVVGAIAAEGIDILVDLNGHTNGARLSIARLTDAPVTATYLGYPGTVTGAGFDYLISDPGVTPDSAKPHYGEKLCRLPETQMPNGVLRDDGPVKLRRADMGLPEDRFVFASFNAPYKITPRTIDLWVRILKSVPASVLWMMCTEGPGRGNLLKEFKALGIDTGRIIFASKVLSFADHVARVALADLALDTLPYNGHSTTADMLRAGLPVVTVRGRSYHSRVTANLLECCGMVDLIAEDDEAFCQMAVSLATEPVRLDETRARLQENRKQSPLFQPARMARHLESAFELMAERARQGLPPDHIDVPALP